MKKFALILALLIPFIGLPQPAAHATVPHLITYQGILKDSSGNLLTGTYSIVFKIYTASTGGTAAWTETQSSVSVSSGRFSVQLGSVTTLDLGFGADYWLSIKVGSDSEMTPRVRLTSSGYAYIADEVVNGFTQSQHSALSHMNIEGVRSAHTNITKTNFKLDSYTNAVANNMGDLYVDAFFDDSGIDAGASSSYSRRGSPNYDVVAGGGGIDSNVVLLLHANGTDGSTTFTDSSSSAKTVTASGQAQIDTAQYNFGAASALFDGTGDYVSTGDSNDWDFGTGDFTVDWWFRTSTTSNNATTFFSRNANTDFSCRINNSDQIIVNIEGTAHNLGTWTESANNWYHMAVIRTGSTVRFFIDGTQFGTDKTSSADMQGTTGLYVGAQSDGSEPIGKGNNAWIDEFRVSKGVARWTANFTKPSAEYSSSTSGTVISNAITQGSAPTEVILTASETLGTGSITYYVSRDNGTTWTTVTKEQLTSISSQPTGTQLKWKAAITGNAELDAIGIAIN